MTPHAMDEPQDERTKTNGENGHVHMNGSNASTANHNDTAHGTHPSSHGYRSHLQRAASNDELDLVCVGFGPANLALAAALHDRLRDLGDDSLPKLSGRQPKVVFLERQAQFTWHEGMLLPGTKMQISFIKDLATLRDPRSEFTFLNYLHKNKRLVSFSNLDTFLPQRIEYQDYMRWCAGWFEDVVDYGKEVINVAPNHAEGRGTVQGFEVSAKDTKTDVVTRYHARHVIIAVGGKPFVPKPFPSDDPRVIHSSSYAKTISTVLTDASEKYKIAVVGGGQSAAEIFNDLHSRYPHAQTRLIIKSSALKPSDDSPFVNEIFDPDRVDSFYRRTQDSRHAAISQDRSTNYGVVRLALLEHIYGTLYTQRIREPNEEEWQHRILSNQAVSEVSCLEDRVQLRLRNLLQDGAEERFEESKLQFDAVVVAAGYNRDAHETMLSPSKDVLLRQDEQRCQVGRDYKVQFTAGEVSEDAGVWLQGCNEGTHGLSDTLLSILATRSDEIVRSIFG